MNRKKTLTQIINTANNKIIAINDALRRTHTYTLTPAQDQEWDYWAEEKRIAQRELRMMDILKNNLCNCR